LATSLLFQLIVAVTKTCARLIVAWSLSTAISGVFFYHTMAATLLEYNQLRKMQERVSRMCKYMLRQLATTINAMCPDLPMASVCPLSWPKVRFRAHQHTIKSYHFWMVGHRQLAIMMVNILVTSTATQNGLNLMHFDAESVPIKVDNYYSKCITNDISNMIPSLIKQTTKIVRGFKGEQCAASCRGMI